MATLTGKSIATTYDQLWFRGTTEPSGTTGAVNVLTTENDGTDDLATKLYLGTERIGIGNILPGRLLEVSESAANSYLEISTWSTSTSETSYLTLSKSSSATINTEAVTASGESLGIISFSGVDSSSAGAEAVTIRAEQDGSAGSNEIPGRLIFATGTNAATPQDRMRIDSNSRISLSNNDASGGASCTLFGYSAGNSIADGGDHNTIVGHNAGLGISTGEGNTAFGWCAMDGASTQADHNTAIGFNALGGGWGTAAVLNCVAIGKNTLLSDSLASGASGTIAIGASALTALEGGANNVAIGKGAADALVSGANNTVVGTNAFGAAGAGETNNIIIGTSAANLCDEGTNGTINDNIAIGLDALTGGDLGTSTATLNRNIAIGTNALNSTGTSLNSGNIAQIGTIAIGYDALTALTDGLGNTGVGYQAGSEINGGHRNTAIGYGAMYLDAGLDNSDNTFVGWTAGGGDWTTGTCSNNTGIGVETLAGAMNACNNNTAVGYRAGKAITSSSNNTAIGYQALTANTTGSDNTAIGYAALSTVNNATADENVGVGYSAGGAISTGSRNTCIGFNANVDNGGDIGHTRLGYRGIMQYYTNRITCDRGGGATGDPAHLVPIGKIPRYAVITRATCVVRTLGSDANHSLMLVLSSDSSGTDNDPLSNIQELIGADATHSWSATGAAGAAADIKVDDGTNGAVIKTAYVAIPYDPAGATDSGLATLDTATAATYVYLAHADTSHTNGDADPTTAPVVDVMIEYAGID